MKCSRAKDLLELSRPGERSEQEDRELAGHLAVCGRCAREHAGAADLSRRIAELRSIEPQLADPHGMVRSVMETLDRRSVRPRRRAPWILVFAAGTRFQAASLACVAMIVAAFLVQTTGDARKLAGLEQRLGGIRIEAASAGLADPGQLLELIPPGRLRTQLAGIAKNGKLLEAAGPRLLARYMEALRGLSVRSMNSMAFPAVQAGESLWRAQISMFDSLVSKGGAAYER